MSKLKKSLSILLASSSIFASQVGATEVVIPKSKHEKRANVASGILTSIAAGGSFFKAYLADSAMRDYKKNLEADFNNTNKKGMADYIKKSNEKQKSLYGGDKNTNLAIGSLITILSIIRRLLPNRVARGITGAGTALAAGTAFPVFYNTSAGNQGGLLADAEGPITVLGGCGGLAGAIAETLHTGLEQARLYKDHKENHLVREKAALEKSVKEKQNELEKVKKEKQSELEKVNVALKQKEENKKS